MAVTVLVGLTLAFGFLAGFNGSGSLVATLIASRAFGARRSLLLAAIGSFIGLFLFGMAAAQVVGTNLVRPTGITLASVGAGLIAALAWNSLASRLGVPSSSSHALLGGLIGGGIAAGGVGVVQLNGMLILVFALLLAPAIGAFCGWWAMRLTLWLARGASPQINEFFRRGQIFTSFFLALSFGTSNGQKIVGIIALILFRGGITPQFLIPDWVVFSTALSIAIGIALGGSRSIRKLAEEIFRLRPIHGFVSQGVTTTVVLVATILGGPVSLNQIMGSAIVGTGASERMSKVRWTVVFNIVFSWLVTLPATALVAIMLYPLVALIAV